MPSRPSLARTVRKEAGTETRPLVSIRLVNVDTNWSISPSRTRADAGTVAKAWGAGPCPKNWWEKRRRPPVASKGPRPAPPTLYSPNGQLWDNMGKYGRQWTRLGLTRLSKGNWRKTAIPILFFG